MFVAHEVTENSTRRTLDRVHTRVGTVRSAGVKRRGTTRGPAGRQ